MIRIVPYIKLKVEYLMWGVLDWAHVVHLRLNIRVMPRDTFTTLWDELLSEGVVSITASDLEARAGTSAGSAHVAVHFAKRARKLFSPTKGLYVLVPPEYRTWGVVPADWFIDDMMRHLRRKYYIGYLTAAAMHGASHHAAQVFQVITDRRVKNRVVGNLRLQFHSTSGFEKRAVQKKTGPTGSLVVATPETCALDLAEHPDRGGGVNVLLEVIGGLQLNPDQLTESARSRSRATVRRCGWVLERTHPQLDLEGLRRLAEPGIGDATLLVVAGERRGNHDRAWGVLVNTLAEGGA
jgi:predicted transcriptional regulator of viral defense system